jgi:hypothetical protein
MRNDEFNLFIRDRARQLLNLIEQAMGRKISGCDSEGVIKEYGGPLTPTQTDGELVA